MIKNKFFRIFVNFIYIFGWFYISLKFTLKIVTPLVHEQLHAVVCSAVGIKPVVGYATTDCTNGISDFPALIQYLHVSMPYIFFFLSTIAIYLTYERIKIMKYFVLIPTLEVVANLYSLFLGVGDYYLLLIKVNTFTPIYDFFTLLFMGCTLVLSASVMRKTHVYRYSSLKEDFGIDIDEIMNKISGKRVK